MKPKLLQLIISFFSLWVSGTPSHAQSHSQRLFWYGYTLNLNLSSKWFNETELMERHFVNPFEQSQFLVRTRFHKKVSEKINYGVGGSVFLFHKSGSNDDWAFTQPELRPHGELTYRSGLGGIVLENRFRGELRYFQNVHHSSKELSDGYFLAGARFRYRFQTIISLVKISQNEFLKLKLADEFMVMTEGRMNKASFDQNRISADFSVDFSPKISVDLGYVNWYQNKPDGGFLMQHIFRTVLKHQINSNKK